MIQPPNNPVDFSQIKRVLVTKLRFHGDVLLSSPVFQTLKRHHPHLEIDALIYKETTDMLSLHPAISQIFTIDQKWQDLAFFGRFAQERTLLAKLRERQYDMMIHLTEDWRGFYLKYLLSIPIAVTGQYERREKSRLWHNCFTHIYPLPHGRDKAASHIDALRHVGIAASKQEEQTSLTISADDQKHVTRILSSNQFKRNEFILVHPTSRFFYKCWPPQTMAAFINRLTESGYQVAVTGAPSSREMQYVNEMMKSITLPILNLSGQLSLKQLGAAIEHSRCLVGVDSAPMHMAVAVKTPVVALFGPTDIHVWGPKSLNSVILQSNTTSKPALVDGKRPNELENCTLDIDIDAVVQATLKLVQKNPQSTPSQLPLNNDELSAIMAEHQDFNDTK